VLIWLQAKNEINCCRPTFSGLTTVFLFSRFDLKRKLARGFQANGAICFSGNGGE
jgi:hypothetical protein